jgi:hypothetical protein
VHRRWRHRESEFAELGRELRRNRPQPRKDFLDSLVAAVHGRPADAQRRGSLRGGLALSLTGLMVVAIASFGGVGYARSVASDAIKKVDRAGTQKRPAAVQAPTSAQAQYGQFTPPSTTPIAPTTTGQQFTPPKASSKAKGAGKGTGTSKGKGNAQAAGAQTNAGTAVAGQTGSNLPASGQTGSNLPFTGLALWIPMALGALLIAAGLALRSRGRKADKTA